MNTIHDVPRGQMTSKLTEAMQEEFFSEEVGEFRRMFYHRDCCLDEEMVQEVNYARLRERGNLMGMKPIVLGKEFQARVGDTPYGTLEIAGIAKEMLYNDWVTIVVWLNWEYLGQIRWVNTMRRGCFPICVESWKPSKRKMAKLGMDQGVIERKRKKLDACVQDVIALVNACAPWDQNWTVPPQVVLE